PAGVHLPDRLLEQREDDLALVAEVILQVALADAAALGDAAGGDRRGTVLVEELQCRLQDAELRGAGCHGLFSPSSACTIKKWSHAPQRLTRPTRPSAPAPQRPTRPSAPAPHAPQRPTRPSAPCAPAQRTSRAPGRPGHCDRPGDASLEV